MADRPEGEEADPTVTEGPPAAGGRARRRRPRRVLRPPTNPAADDSPDVGEPREGPGEGASPHDRWLHEQRPPHWE